MKLYVWVYIGLFQSVIFPFRCYHCFMILCWKQNRRHYYCICGKVFDKKNFITNHATKSHQNKTPAYVSDPREEDIEVQLIAITEPVKWTHCAQCWQSMHSENLARHITRRHKKPVPLHAICVDMANGKYMVAKNYKGNQYPLHVIFLLSGPRQKVACENEICEQASLAAQRSDCALYQCQHVLNTSKAVGRWIAR